MIRVARPLSGVHSVVTVCAVLVRGKGLHAGMQTSPVRSSARQLRAFTTSHDGNVVHKYGGWRMNAAETTNMHQWG